MRTPLRRTLVAVSALLIVLACGGAPRASAASPRVLYLYGDVAADGTVPSGPAAPFHQMRLADTGDRGLSQFKTAIEEAGFVLDETYDATLTLTAETLAPYAVLILGSNQHRYTPEEATALAAWIHAGGGLVAWSDSAFGGAWQQVGIGNTAGLLSNNDLTLQFGMRFLRDNGAGVYSVRQYEFAHFLNDHDPAEGVVFRGEGVSPVRVSPPAVLLAKLQAGGSGGGIRLNAADGALNPATDAALAIAEIGAGRVIGVFDRNTFWNAGEGTRLSEVDNREFAQRLVRWAAKSGADPLATLPAWREFHFTAAELADPAVSGPEATPAGDGLPNLLKYHLGLAPRISAPPSARPFVALETPGAATLALSYWKNRHTPGAQGVVEWSTTLAPDDWSAADVEVEVLAQTATREHVVARVAVAGRPRLFLRLRVTPL